jgi:hypothetical protein
VQRKSTSKPGSSSQFAHDDNKGSRTYQLVLRKFQLLPDDSTLKASTVESIAAPQNTTVAGSSKASAGLSNIASKPSVHQATSLDSVVPQSAVAKGKRKATTIAQGTSKRKSRAVLEDDEVTMGM